MRITYLDDQLAASERSYEHVLKTRLFFSIITDDVDSDHKVKGNWDDTFLTVSRTAANESLVPS